MRETLLNNTLGHTKPNLDKLKNIVSDNSVSFKTASFDSYLDTQKPKINTQKLKISEKPIQQATHNQKKVYEIDSSLEKQQASEVTDTKSTESTAETKTLDESDDDAAEDTKLQENTQIIPNILTQLFPPLTDGNTHAENFTALDMDMPPESQTIEDLNGLPLTQSLIPTDTQTQLLEQASLLINPATEFHLNREDTVGDIDEQISETELETDDLSSEITMPLDNQEKNPLENIVLSAEKSDSQPIQIDTSADKHSGTQTMNDIGSLQGIFQNSNNLPQIQIQKASSIENIAQISLDNMMSVTITKDTGNENKIGINLEPAGMGEVELVIETNSDNAVMAVIRSDKPEILEQLRKESASLERYLTEAGLNLGGQGLGFEHRQNDNQHDNQNNQNANNVLNASILESGLSETQNNKLSMSATEKLYTHLDKQSIQAGLDIRL